MHSFDDKPFIENYWRLSWFFFAFHWIDQMILNSIWIHVYLYTDNNFHVLLTSRFLSTAGWGLTACGSATPHDRMWRFYRAWVWRSTPGRPWHSWGPPAVARAPLFNLWSDSMTLRRGLWCVDLMWILLIFSNFFYCFFPNKEKLSWNFNSIWFNSNLKYQESPILNSFFF